MLEEVFVQVEDNGVSTTGEVHRRSEDERWHQQQTVLRRAAADLSHRRAESPADRVTDRNQVNQDVSLDLLRSLDDASPEARNLAIRAFYDLNPDLAASFLNKALMQGSPEERRNIGAALVGSGLADHAVDTLTCETPDNAYSAFSLLFLVAKAGEVGPLMRVIEDHPNIQLRLAVIKLLALSGEPKIVTAFFGLAQRSSLPLEIRSAVREAIFQISRETR
ncbi:MAG: hypothetical protein ND895_23500 [Pyrinomonadaceae bacterium]|nr:hypothetical protein [Pyrinomonadaceae bacterium]